MNTVATLHVLKQERNAHLGVAPRRDATMVVVLVCKNDGCFELEQADVALDALAGWHDVKMHLARVLYCEEELFAVASPDEIALYRLPDGESIAGLAASCASTGGGDANVNAQQQRQEIQALLVPDSRWVLDIFSAPMRRMSDLTQQTDHAIRGVRKSSLAPIGRRTSTMPPPGAFTTCALGNERFFSDPSVCPSTAASPPHRSASAVVSAVNNASSVYHEPYIHIGTWVPLMVTDKPKAGLASASSSSGGLTSNSSSNSLLSHVLKPLTSEFEDVLVTTNRAREYINRFRRVGRPVTILSIQTTLLPLAVASPNTISHQGPRVLYEGVYTLSESDAQRGFIQAVRLWFSFDCEQTVSVTKVHGALGLKPLRQQDGWIVVQALPGSPAFEAGMRGDEAFLTHVNGVDVSPLAFPAVGSQSRSAAQGLAGAPGASSAGQTHVSWKESVIPLVEKCETCIFTFF